MRTARATDELRPVVITPAVAKFAAGSARIELGDTHVLCTASLTDGVPGWLRGSGRGWVTAEYSMLPGATPTRTAREAVRGRQSGRTMEIQRLIGRSLRAVVDMGMMGERTIAVDCDVLQADGGTRTASITGAYVAVYQAMLKLMDYAGLKELPLFDSVAAVSVGVVDGKTVSGSGLRGGLRRRGGHERRRHRRRSPRRGTGDGRGRALRADDAGRAARAGDSWSGRISPRPRPPPSWHWGSVMRFVLASGNRHKLQEFGRSCDPTRCCPCRRGIELPPEDVESFAANAFVKAQVAGGRRSPGDQDKLAWAHRRPDGARPARSSPTTPAWRSRRWAGRRASRAPATRASTGPAPTRPTWRASCASWPASPAPSRAGRASSARLSPSRRPERLRGDGTLVGRHRRGAARRRRVRVRPRLHP